MVRSTLLVVTALLATGAPADPATEKAQEQQLEEMRQRQSAIIERDMQRRLKVLMEESIRPMNDQEELITQLTAEDLLLQARTK